MIVEIPKGFFERCVASNLTITQRNILDLIMLHTWYRHKTSIQTKIIHDKMPIELMQDYVDVRFEDDLDTLKHNKFIDIVRDRIHVADPEAYLSKNEISNQKLETLYKDLFNYWNSQEFLIKHTGGVVSRHKAEVTGFIKSTGGGDALKGFEMIKEAIKNYNIILGEEKYYYSNKWTLMLFLKRGMDRFLTCNKPFENFLDFRYKARARQVGKSEYNDFK